MTLSQPGSSSLASLLSLALFHLSQRYQLELNSDQINSLAQSPGSMMMMTMTDHHLPLPSSLTMLSSPATVFSLFLGDLVY